MQGTVRCPLVCFILIEQLKTSANLPVRGSGVVGGSREKQTRLTGNLHDVTRDDLSGLDPLHTLSVSSVDFTHLRFILLQSLDGALSITLLSRVTLHFSPNDTGHV